MLASTGTTWRRPRVPRIIAFEWGAIGVVARISPGHLHGALLDLPSAVQSLFPPGGRRVCLGVFGCVAAAAPQARDDQHLIIHTLMNVTSRELIGPMGGTTQSRFSKTPIQSVR